MKKYSLSFAESIHHIPKNPERTATRQIEWDIEYIIWNNRETMTKTIRKQQEKPWHRNNYISCIPLTDGEGY